MGKPKILITAILLLQPCVPAVGLPLLSSSPGLSAPADLSPRLQTTNISRIPNIQRDPSSAHPPPNPYSYSVPDSRITVQFAAYIPSPTTNATFVSLVLKLAIADVLTVQHDGKVPFTRKPKVYNYEDRVSLGVESFGDMSWGNWAAALNGIGWFVKKYEGWGFMAFVYVEGMPFSVGFGWLEEALPPGS